MNVPVSAPCGDCRTAPCGVCRQVKRSRQRAVEAGYHGPHLRGDEWLALLECFGGRCLCCGAREGLTVDHVIPLALEGPNTIANVQPLCAACNNLKGGETTDYR